MYHYGFDGPGGGYKVWGVVRMVRPNHPNHPVICPMPTFMERGDVSLHSPAGGLLQGVSTISWDNYKDDTYVGTLDGLYQHSHSYRDKAKTR